jgi:DNA repair exonuclease SbcCD ATPase subunit
MRILVTSARADRPNTADSEEVMRLQQELLAEREAKRELQNRVDTLTREIATWRSSEGSSDADIRGQLSAAVGHASVLQSQLLDAQGKLQAAEEKNSLMERQLTEQTKGPEGWLGHYTGSFRKIIVGSVALVCVLLAYGVGYRVSESKNPQKIPPSNQNAVNELKAIVTQDQDQINNLKSQLDAANQNLTKVNEEVAKGSTKEAATQKKLEQTQGLLKAEEDQNRQNSMVVNQLKDQLQSKTREATHLRQQTSDIGAELAALQKKHPSWNYAGVPEGTFRWQGELKEKSANIVIDQTGVHVSNARNSYSQGSLPLVPFGWKQVVVNADGKGKVTAQLVWSVF